MITNTTKQTPSFNLRAAAKTLSLGLIAAALVLGGSAAFAGQKANGGSWNGQKANGGSWNGVEAVGGALTIEGVTLSGGRLVQR